MTAFLEQMPPRRAVHRLELAQDDLDRLAESCRQWASGPIVEADRLDDAPTPTDGRGRRDRTLRAGQPRRGPRRRPRTLQRQTHRVERLARRVRREWQEKLLALRMEALLGRRSLAILENTVLALIPVLIGLIVAESFLERSGALSAAQHRFFAWADLAICSVFLFEFGLKLCLAPDRMAYFLHHLLIDLIPSLPFGFVAHEIDLTEMGTAAANQSGDAGSPGGLRTDGPGPAVHPADPADRPVDAGGAHPPEAERSPGPPPGRAAQSQHHPVRALGRPEARIERPPSTAGDPQRAGARPGRRREPARPRTASETGRPDPLRLRLPDRTAPGPGDRRDQSGRRTARDPGRSGGRASDPDDPRAAHRPDGAVVRGVGGSVSPPAERPADPPAAAGPQAGERPREEPGGGRGPGRQLPGLH